MEQGSEMQLDDVYYDVNNSSQKDQDRPMQHTE